MTPKIATKLARLQAQFPYKKYSELCAMIARRPRKRSQPMPHKNIRLPYAD